MKPETARACLGKAVGYEPYPGGPEEHGLLISVNSGYGGDVLAFVRFGRDAHAKAVAVSHLWCLNSAPSANAIHEAWTRYQRALADRKHGGLAADDLIRDLGAALGRSEYEFKEMR